jgi:membrane protein
MEGRRRTQYQTSEHGDHGRSAESPTEIPKRGWRDVLLRVKDGLTKHNISIVAAGTGFFLLLGLIPGIAALISIYGLIANPSDVEAQFASVSQMMPSEVRRLLEGEMTRIASAHHQAGIAAIVSILLALWGGAAAMKSLMTALNIVYNEEEKRGYVKLTLTALALTGGLIISGVVSIGLIVGLPPVLDRLGIGDAAKTVVSLVRWPLLLVLALLALALVYRHGPSRDKPKWKWVSVGALVATVLWVASSALFSFYASHFGSYNKTYGSLGAVIVLMMWLYISAFVVLLGGEINAELEHQTAKDTTTGSPEPLGRRGAYVADNIGESR